MAVQESTRVYTAYASKVLHSWTVLRICINEGSGGPGTEYKINNLVDQMLSVARRLKDEDKLADFLEDYLDDELNMICEDGSISEVAKLLMDGYYLIRNNQLPELQAKMNSLPAPCDLSQCQSQTATVEFDGDAEGSESSEEDTDEGNDFPMDEL